MSVEQISATAKIMALNIINEMKDSALPNYPLSLLENSEISGFPETVFDHVGIYGFSIERDNKIAIAYIGKAESGSRLRQHLTGKNRDGTPLKPSVSNKNNKLKSAIRDGYIVALCLFSDSNFDKASLSCVEIASSLYAREDCSIIFPAFKHWNERIG